MKGNLYCYCENNPVVCFDSSGNELEVLDAFVDDYTKVFEMYNGKPTPINYGIQPGTYCRIINDWNKDLVYVEYYHNCSWQKGYIQKKYLDYSGSYRSDSGENVFGFLGNNSGGTKCYHESSYGRDVLMLNICLNKYFDAIEGVHVGQLPYQRVPITMEYTDKTREYVEIYQSLNGLTVDGFAGYETLLSIQSWLIDINDRG